MSLRSIQFSLALPLLILAPERAVAKDIVDTAVDAGSFKTLVAAVQAVGLVDTLKGEGPFTVFAPTDDAFGRLPGGTVEALLKPENRGQLKAILTYHVVPGRVPASKAKGLSKAGTVNGAELGISRRIGGLFINDSKVIQTDIMCSNGIIHVIDEVLMPPDETSAKVHRKLMQAIQHGVPMFNRGHHKACADLYEKAARSAMQMGPSALSSRDRMELSEAMKRARREGDAGKRAWIMRDAFDSVLARGAMRL